MTRRLAAPLVAVALCLAAVVPALANGFTDSGSSWPGARSSYSPRVPLSAFTAPASWFDPSRLHVSSTVTVGSGFDGRASGLSVTRLSYAFGAPVTMGVSLGNTFGLDRARGGSPFFLEGLDLAWRPNANSLFRVEFHDVRSPLQYSRWGHGWGPAIGGPYPTSH
jgi:hypothetical protein